MNLTDFIGHPGVAGPIGKLKESWGKKPKAVSNILDENGNQYVDIVMEGGGVLGIALVGYTYALESVGIRFLGIGGTSAGAINALLLAGLDVPEKPKSVKILKALADLNMFEFVDGDSDARDLIRSKIEGAGTMKLAWKGMQVIDNLQEDLGLNPGTVFLTWLMDRLEESGVRTLSDLRKIMTPPALVYRDGKKVPRSRMGSKLSVVATDITTETKVVLPEMADLYWYNPARLNPALFVRASMSIPFFFHPLRVTDIPHTDRAVKRWEEAAGYEGELPYEVLMMDGGLMSNFPINLFHESQTPAAPTFGIKLGFDRSRPVKIEKPLEMAGAMFNSARHCLDYDFLWKNPDYELLVAAIDTKGYNWLDFYLDEEAKVDLFRRGVETGIEFLKEFDWENYKKIRAQIPLKEKKKK